MIELSNIGKENKLYEFLFPIYKFNHDKLYYKKTHLINPENIPSDGTPTLIVSNHQNGLKDALIILFISHKGNRPIFIARGDMFKKDKIAKILKFLKILPAFRVRDAGKEHLSDNEMIFNLSADLLNQNYCLTMYPEATHQKGHFLGSFKKGFARTAFRAMEANDFKLNLQILPVANHYSNLHDSQHEVILYIGKPFTINHYRDLYKEHPEKAQLELAQQARNAVKDIMLDIDDSEFYSEIDAIRLMFTPLKLKNQQLHDFPAQFEYDKHLIKALRRYKETDETQYRILMQNVQEWLSLLKILHIENINNNTIGKLIGKFVLYGITFPVFICSSILSILPYLIYNHIGRNIKDAVLQNSVRQTLYIVASPIWCLIYVLTAWAIGNIWWALIILILTICSHIIFYRLLNFYRNLKNDIKHCYYILSKNQLYKKTEEIKQNLISSVNNLVKIR